MNTYPTSCRRSAAAGRLLGGWLLATTAAASAAEPEDTAFQVLTNPQASGQLVSIDDARVSILATDMPIEEILEEIAIRFGLVLLPHKNIEERISADYRNVRIDYLLKRILGERSFVIAYRASRPTALWIIDAGGDVRPEPRVADAPHRTLDNPESAGDDFDDLAALEVALSSRREATRESAAEGLVNAPGMEASVHLGNAIMDASASVRDAAIGSLIEIGGREGTQALGLALGHPDPRVREDIVYALAEISDEIALGFLQQALTDANPHVREAAADALRERR